MDCAGTGLSRWGTDTEPELLMKELCGYDTQEVKGRVESGRGVASRESLRGGTDPDPQTCPGLQPHSASCFTFHLLLCSTDISCALVSVSLQAGRLNEDRDSAPPHPPICCVVENGLAWSSKTSLSVAAAWRDKCMAVLICSLW